MLRNIMYIDEGMVDDYVSEISGCYPSESVEISKTQGAVDAGGKAAIFNVGAKVDAGVKTEQQVERRVSMTNANKLDMIINYLSSGGELCRCGVMGKDEREYIQEDVFVEAYVTPRLSRAYELVAAAKEVRNLNNIMRSFPGANMMDEEAEKNFELISRLSDMLEKRTITYVLEFEDGDFPLITYVNEDYIKCASLHELLLPLKVLCKVQRVVPDGDKFIPDQILKGLDAFATNREQRRQIDKSRKVPNEAIGETIIGPAAVVAPIAMYR